MGGFRTLWRPWIGPMMGFASRLGKNAEEDEESLLAQARSSSPLGGRRLGRGGRAAGANYREILASSRVCPCGAPPSPPPPPPPPGGGGGRRHRPTGHAKFLPSLFAQPILRATG